MYFVSETAQVELKSGLVYKAPGGHPEQMRVFAVCQLYPVPASGSPFFAAPSVFWYSFCCRFFSARQGLADIACHVIRPPGACRRAGDFSRTSRQRNMGRHLNQETRVQTRVGG